MITAEDPRLITPQLQERLIDTLTVMALLIQRLDATTRQQAADVHDVLGQMERVVAVLEQLKPTVGAQS